MILAVAAGLLALPGAPLGALLGVTGGPQDLEAYARTLGEDDDWAARKAVQGLAELDTAAAWEAVVGALADPRAMVADEAQLALRGADATLVLALLDGKRGLRAKAPLIRERAVEVLGHLWAAEGAASSVEALVEGLVDALADREEGVRRAALGALERAPLERLGEPPPDDLRRALELAAERDGSVELRAAALLAQEALGAAPDWGAALDARDPALRVAGALLAGRLAEHPVDALAAALEDADAAVRRAAVEALAERSTAADAGGAARAIALRLVGRLEVEPRLRLRWRLVELLAGLSGRRHGLDPRPWRDWADGLADDWRPESAAAGSLESSAGDASSRAALVGQPLRSDRIVFLVDLSGSIWTERADGTSRKQRVDEELERTLTALPETARFNLIVYTDRPVAFDDELVPADSKRVKSALRWFEKRKDYGVGDLWSALELALAMPEADTLTVLSDGSPSGGERWNLSLMAELFAQRNRLRRVTLDAVLTDPSPSIVHRWERIASESGGGRVHRVELE